MTILATLHRHANALGLFGSAATIAASGAADAGTASYVAGGSALGVFALFVLRLVKEFREESSKQRHSYVDQINAMWVRMEARDQQYRDDSERRDDRYLEAIDKLGDAVDRLSQPTTRKP